MKISRPLLATLALVVAALYLGFPHAAIVTLLTGALIGFLIGSVNGSGAEFSILAIGVASLWPVMMLMMPSFSDQPGVPLYSYAAISWVVGFALVGVTSLLSRPK